MNHKFWILAALLAAFHFQALPAQSWKEMMQQPQGYTLEEIRAEFDRYYETHPQDKYWKQFRRWEYQMSSRLGADGKVVNVQARTWANYREFLSQRSFSTAKTENTGGGNWTFFGSSDYEIGGEAKQGGVGRINVLAFHPTDPDIIYAGSPSGGLWKSTDGGKSWAPLTDGIAIWGISGIAIDPVNPNTIYILTGDGDGSQSYSTGVWKTVNGGATWSPTGLNFEPTPFDVDPQLDGYKLLMDPSDRRILYAVMTDGLHKTTNSGTSWTVVQSGSFRDLEFKPNDPNTLYLSGEREIFRSTDAGGSWSLTYSFPSRTERVALAVTPADNDIVYAVAGNDAPTALEAVLRSTDAGQTWNIQTNNMTEDILGFNITGGGPSQPKYDLAISVSPTNASEVHVGAINIWRSTDAGQNWTIQTAPKITMGYAYTHADIHDLVYHDGSLFSGTDGGVFRSDNAGADWEDLSAGLGITEFYRLAGTPQNHNLITAGAQDNGSNILHSPIPDLTMTHVLGGDGTDAAIDPNDQQILYNSFQDGELRRSTNGGLTYDDISTQKLGEGDWVTPFVLHPTVPNYIVAGYTDVGYHDDITDANLDWVKVDGLGSGKVRAISYAPSNPDTFYAVKSDRVSRQINFPSTGAWADISPSVSEDVTYTNICVSDVDPMLIFVTCGGWVDGEKVFRSTDGGSSWENISDKNLPNVPVNVVAFEPGSPNGVYIGTDAGVYYRDDNTDGWIDFSNGLPFVRVTDLEINAGSGQIRASTWGRSIWESTLWSVNNCIDVITLDGPVTDELRFESNLEIHSTQQVDNQGEIEYSTTELITLNPGFQVALGGTFLAEMEGCVVGTMKQAQPITGTYEEGTDPGGVPEAVDPAADFLLGNYPNPFHRHTWIQIELPEADHLDLEIFDTSMRRVALVLEGEQLDAGLHTLPFDGAGLSSGLYFLRATGNSSSLIRQIQIQR